MTVAGILNPKDYTHATATRPTFVGTGINQRRWFSDSLGSRVYAQDLNNILGQFRYLFDFYSLTDVEGDDTMLQQAIATGAASLSGNLLAFQGLAAASDKVPFFSSSAPSMSSFVASLFSRNIMASTNAAQWRDSLGISALTSDNVTAFANLTSAADLLPYFTGVGTMATLAFNSFARSLAGAVDAATARNVLGFGSAVPSAFFQTIIDDADAATMQATLGLAAIASSGSASDLASGTLPSARLPASLSSIYILTPTADRLPYYTSASAAALATFTAFGRSLVDDADAATARATLGLATVAATGAASDLSGLAAIGLSGSASDLSAGTVPSARFPASLSSIYGLTPAADQLPYYTGASAAALTTLSSFARTVIDDADAATMRGTIGAANIAGDTFTGAVLATHFEIDRTSAASDATIFLHADSGQVRGFNSYTGATIRWQMLLGNSTTESGSNVGTDFVISRYNDAGASLGSPISIARSTGITTLSQVSLTTALAVASGGTGSSTASGARTNLGVPNIAGDTFTGAVTVSSGDFTTSGGDLRIDRSGDVARAQSLYAADAGNDRRLVAYTGSITPSHIRWIFTFADSTAEGGSNAGSDFVIGRYNDSGVSLDNPLKITRSTGIMSLTQIPTHPTPSGGDNSTKSATTAFVAAGYQPLDAELTALAGLVSAADRLPYFTGSGAAALATFTSFARTLVDDVDAATSRTTLGLGTAAVEATGTSGHALGFLDGTNTVSGAWTFTGNPTISSAANGALFISSPAASIRSIRFQTAGSERWRLAANSAAEGGSNAGSNFTIGSYDDAGALLDTPVTITRSTGIMSLTQIPTHPTPSGGDNSTKSATTAFVAAGYQPLDTELTAIAGLTSAADRLPYFTGSGVASLATFTSFARTLVDDADAATARTTLGLGTAAVEATGTSGHVLPFLDGVNTWAGAQTFNSDVTISIASGDLSLALSGPAAQNRAIHFQTAGSERWKIQANATAESGSNNGSNLTITSFDDSGATIETPFSFVRSTGILTLKQLALTNALSLANGGTGGTDAASARTGLGLGTAATQNTGTSGSTIPFLNTVNTWSANQWISTTNPFFIADKSASGNLAGYDLRTATVTRWRISSDSDAESGSNVGSSFHIQRYNDAGTILGTPVSIARATGLMTITGFAAVTAGVTPSAGDNTTNLATTAFVQSEKSTTGNYFNYARNPSFHFWQAGTSIASPSNFYIADCWKTPSTAGRTYSRQAGFNGANYCCRAQRDNGNAVTTGIGVYAVIPSELAYQLAGQTIYIAADMRAGANWSGTTIVCSVIQGTGVDEVLSSANATFPTGTSNTSLAAVQNANLTTTAARAIWGPITINSGTTEIGFRFTYTPTGTAGAADYFEVTNVWFGIATAGGSVPKFQPTPISEVRAQAERLYQKSFQRDTTPAQNVGQNTGEIRFNSLTAGATAARYYVRLRLPLFFGATRTITLYNPAAANAHIRDYTAAADMTAEATANVTEDGFQVTATGPAGMAANDDLGFHYVIDARNF